MNDLVLEVLYKNTLTCPECGSQEVVEMLSLEKTHEFTNVTVVMTLFKQMKASVVFIANMEMLNVHQNKLSGIKSNLI